MRRTSVAPFVMYAGFEEGSAYAAVCAMYADVVAALCERRLSVEYEPAVVDRHYNKRADAPGSEAPFTFTILNGLVL
jgi:hypothetical protein